MEIKHYYQDGTPVPEGRTVTPDIYEQTFMVKVRSFYPISSDNLHDLIGKKYANAVQYKECKCFVRNTHAGLFSSNCNWEAAA